MMYDQTRTDIFDTWVGQRSVAEPTSNIESKDLPFQSWRPFKEAFAPEIVHRAVSETEGSVGHLLDPFGGSGTSALTAQLLNVFPTTVEVNPYLADLIEAKLTQYSVQKLVDAAEALEADFLAPKMGRRPSLQGLPPTFVEPGVKGRFIFSLDLAKCLERLLRAINRIDDAKAQRLFRVLLSTVAMEASNVRISGKGRRYRSNWNTRQTTGKEMSAAFFAKVHMAIRDIGRFSYRPQPRYDLRRGDARRVILKPATQDVAVFSPPYPNSFDYTDVYNVELWLLGYLKKWSDNRTLRTSTLRSHVQVKRPYGLLVNASLTLEATYHALCADRDALWSKDIPEMVSSYFKDMSKVMAIVGEALRERGRVYCVVGDSQYAGHAIPVAQILKELAPSFGLVHIHSEQFRSMRASPQQGGRPELPETMLVFRKP